MEKIKAIFKTGSNYKNCNGKVLEVIKLSGTNIECKVPYYGFNPESGEPETDMTITSTFSVRELVSIYHEL